MGKGNRKEELCAAFSVLRTGSLQDQVILFICTGFFSGLAPWAQGTAGSIAALLIFSWLQQLYPPLTEFWPALSFALIVTAAAIYATNQLCARKILGETKDPKPVVIDEFAGLFIAAAGLSGLIPLILAFFWFRVFDILKPPPVRQLEKLPSGWGIVLDDAAAGFLAMAAARICIMAIK